MPKWNMSNYDENSVGKFPTPPPDKYLCRVDSCRNTKKNGELLLTKDGHEMWALELSIDEDKNGAYGALLKDLIIWSPKAGARAKLILKAFGINVSLDREYMPEELLDKMAIVTVEGTRTETWIDNEGNQKSAEKPVIGFAGYEPAMLEEYGNNGEDFPSKQDDEIPF